jgi:hypothetical protein
MAINFPSNPANNDVYSFNGKTWYWANNNGVWLVNTYGQSATLNVIVANNITSNFINLDLGYITVGNSTVNTVIGNSYITINGSSAVSNNYAVTSLVSNNYLINGSITHNSNVTIANTLTLGNTTVYTVLSNSSISVGNSTVNAVINTTSVSINGNILSSNVYNQATYASNTYSTATFASNDYFTSGTISFTGVRTFNSNVVFGNTLIANGSAGTQGQVLASNGTVGSPYWTTITSSGGGFSNGQSIAVSLLSVNTSTFVAANLNTTNATFYVPSYYNANVIIAPGSVLSANGGFGSAGQVLTSNGSVGSPYWSTVSAGGGSITVTNDTSTASNFYPTLTTATSGTISGITTSSSYLYFVPSTGTLNSQIFNSLSDINKKTNIETINSSIDIINKLRGVSFDWKDNGNHSYGLIAQEVEQVIPDIVSTGPDGTKTLNYDALIGFLIEAIKQLSNGYLKR